MKIREPKRFRVHLKGKVHFLARSRQMTGRKWFHIDIGLCGVIASYGGDETCDPITCKDCIGLWREYTEEAWTPDSE